MTPTEPINRMGPMASKRKYQIALANTEARQQDANTAMQLIKMLKKLVITVCD